MIVSICAVYWKKSNKEIESIKEELLASIIEIVSEDNSELNEAVWNAKQPSAAIAVINKYEALLKGENKKKINIVGKQEELLKKFMDSENIFKYIGPSRSNIYFKIKLYKCLTKFPELKNSTLPSSYFNSNFKLLKNLCQENVKIFCKKE